MQQLTIPFIPTNGKEDSFEEISALLNSFHKQSLVYNLWKKSNFTPKASFTIAHNNHTIFIKYFIEEKHVRAFETEINGSVWEDSCVEFFISFGDDGNYYNLEFNCIGTRLAGFVNAKFNKELLPPETVSKVYTTAVIKTTTRDNKYWELTIAIPATVFIHHSIDTLSGMECRANFYKCGDLLPSPHYLAWSNIESPEPNFHLPEFFGNIRFL